MAKILTLTNEEIDSKLANENYGGPRDFFTESFRGILSPPDSDYPFKYVFGVEIENARGLQISSNVSRKGLCLGKKDDSSISGLEYYTGLLSGGEGMRELRRITKLMEGHSYEPTAGTHVHISGIKCLPAFDLPFLFAVIQSSVLEMKPLIVSRERTWVANHICHVSNNTLSESFRSTHALELRRRNISSAFFIGRHAWRVKGSFEKSLVDSTKSNTIEFRILEGTNDFNVLQNSIFLYSIVLDYFEKFRVASRTIDSQSIVNQMINTVDNVCHMVKTCDKINESMRKRLIDLLKYGRN